MEEDPVGCAVRVPVPAGAQAFAESREPVGAQVVA